MPDSASNNNYPTDNPVAQTAPNGATASGQESENLSETSWAKQRREERMQKFDIELETKMRLEQARFELRELKLELKMKELETKHQLVEEERELERKVKRTALENDDVRSQSTSARDKSSFNWTPKKREERCLRLDWASRIDNLLTTDRSTARFELAPEVNRHSHFSRYRSSWDRSTSVEDRAVSPRASLLRYNNGYAGSSSLLKLKLNNFDGSPSIGRSGLVCSLLQWINAQYQTQRRWATWRLYYRARLGQWFPNGLFWTVLWCCMEHSGEEVWTASCDHLCTSGGSSQSQSGETSQLNRSYQFLSYCFELCECVQRVLADWWSAIKLDTVYGSR